MLKPSIYTEIINGKIPSHKIYEDEHTIAILPLHPIALAHVLVIPKKQVDQFFEMEEADYIALMDTVKKVAAHLNEVIKPVRIGLKIIGLDVAHVHVHVIAFDTAEEYLEVENFDAPIDNEKLAKLAAKIAF